MSRGGELFPTLRTLTLTVAVGPVPLQYISASGKATTAKALLDFGTGIEKGSLEPYVKSAEAPAEQTGDVRVVVAKTFKEEVYTGKPTFVEFYAPWCGHCKALAPVWDEFGAWAKNEGVVVSKMDATANDVPDEKFEVTGFPTIYYVSATGDVEKYQGGRALKDFQDFAKAKKEGKTAAASDEAKAEL